MIHVKIKEHEKRENWYHVTVDGVRIANAKKMPSGLFRVSPMQVQFKSVDQIERMMNEEQIEELALRSMHVRNLKKRQGR